MKRFQANIIAGFVAGLLCFVAGATLRAAYTKQTTRVARFQCDPVYDNTGAATNVPIQVFFANRVLVNDANSADVVNPGNFGPITVDLLAAPVATTTYTAAGKTVNGTQLAALLQTMFLAEATRQSVP